jgi:hypothetical protein
VTAERWTPDQLKKLLLMCGSSGAAMLLNPYGYKLLWYPFDLLFRRHEVINDIIEWQSVDFHTGYGKLAAMMIFALLALAWTSRKPWSLRDVILVSFALWTSLSHVRFLLFAAIVLVPVIAPRVHLMAPYDSRKDRPWLNLAIIAAILAIVLVSYPTPVDLQALVDTQFPRDAIRYMQEQKLTGRVFHYYDFGGYIEWTAPGIKTFADGRADIFTYNGVLSDYLRINKINNSLELLDKYRIDYALFPAGKHLTYLLDHNLGWKRIYRDQVVSLYSRASTGMSCSQTAK